MEAPGHEKGRLRGTAMIGVHRWAWVLGTALAMGGCGAEDAPEWVGEIAPAQPRHAPQSPSHHSPPTTQDSATARSAPRPQLATVQVEGRWYTLKASGLGSLSEMRRDLSRLADAEQQDLYRQAFVKTFYYTNQPGSRPYYEAVQAGRQLARRNPAFAPALRCVAQGLLHRTGELERPIRICQMAVAIDPEYAEAHYMLALLLAMARQREQGDRHLAKARQLGLPDYYGLEATFYASTQPRQTKSSPATDCDRAAQDPQ